MDTVYFLEIIGWVALSIIGGCIGLQIAEAIVYRPWDEKNSDLLRCIKMFCATMFLVLCGLMTLSMDWWAIVFRPESVELLRKQADFLFLAVPIGLFLIAAFSLYYTVKLIVYFVQDYMEGR